MAILNFLEQGSYSYVEIECYQKKRSSVAFRLITMKTVESHEMLSSRYFAIQEGKVGIFQGFMTKYPTIGQAAAGQKFIIMPSCANRLELKGNPNIGRELWTEEDARQTNEYHQFVVTDSEEIICGRVVLLPPGIILYNNLEKKYYIKGNNGWDQTFNYFDNHIWEDFFTWEKHQGNILEACYKFLKTLDLFKDCEDC